MFNVTFSIVNNNSIQLNIDNIDLSKDILRRDIDVAPKINENEIDLKKLSGFFKDILAKSY